MILRNETLRQNLTDLLGFKQSREEIMHVDGVKVLDTNLEGNCEVYVFGIVMHEDWFTEIMERDEMWPQNPSPFLRALRTNSIGFLKQRGYQTVESLEDGDVVAYKWKDSREVMHWGIWQRGKVRSKWADYHVFEHDLDAVPDVYGDEAIFLRK